MPFVSMDNAEIYYEAHGEGSPVVLAHGADDHRFHCGCPYIYAQNGLANGSQLRFATRAYARVKSDVGADRSSRAASRRGS